MGAVAFAVAIISVANSVQFGTYHAMEQQILRLSASELQVQHVNFQREQTLEFSIEALALDLDTLRRAHPWIKAASRRLSSVGLASSDSSSSGVLIVGIEPEAESAVSSMVRVRDTDRGLSPGEEEAALLGVQLARNLGLVPGDSVVVLTQGYRNVMGVELYEVRGLVQTGLPELDRSTMLLTLEGAQALYSMPGRYTELVLRTDQHHKAEEHAARLAATMDTTRLAALPWQRLLPEIDQMRRLDDASNYIIYAFLLLLIGFEIFNTTAMSMMERVREFGVMMAMGLQPGQISALVTLELALKVLMGIAAGLVVASVAVLILSQEPIPLTGNMQEIYDDLGFVVDGIHFTRSAVIYTFPVVSVMLLSLLSLLFPLLKMRRFSPVAALRAV